MLLFVKSMVFSEVQFKRMSSLGDGCNSFCSEFSARTDVAGSRGIVRTALIIVSILAAVTTLLLLLIVAAYVCKKSRKPHMLVLLASDGKLLKHC